MNTINIPIKMINRDSYISRIVPFMNQSIIKVLTGSRRVGKSYLLFQLMQVIKNKDINANIIYINMEDYTFSKIKNASDLIEYLNVYISSEQKNYIFIDEIQEIIEFEKSIRSLLLNSLNDIYITGSNANLLSGELSTFLAGRTIEFQINSLSYIEFLNFHKLTDSDDNLFNYIKFGGLPYLIHLELNEDIVFDYLKSIYAAIIYRDVINRYKVRNTNFLEKLVRFLADNISGLFSVKSISDFLKSQQINVSHYQVQTFTDYFVNSFLISKVLRYDLAGKKIFETHEKYYFENIGIRNAIVGYKASDLSKIIENVVYNHLVFLGYEVKIGWLNGLEIDFMATKRNEITYIQVAYRITDEKTSEREFGNLLKIKDNYPKIVITIEADFLNTYQGIQHVSLRKFLTTFR